MTIQSIPVWSTRTGKKHILTIDQPFRRYPSLNGPGELVPLLPTLRLDDGRPIKSVAPGIYQDQWSDEQFVTSKPADAAA